MPKPAIAEIIAIAASMLSARKNTHANVTARNVSALLNKTAKNDEDFAVLSSSSAAITYFNALERGDTVPSFEERPLWLSAQLEAVDTIINTVRYKQTKDADMSKLTKLQVDLLAWLEKDYGPKS